MLVFKRSNNKISKNKKDMSQCNHNPEEHEDHKLLINILESDNISIDPHLLDRLLLLSVKPPPHYASKKDDIKVNLLRLCAFQHLAVAFVSSSFIKMIGDAVRVVNAPEYIPVNYVPSRST